MEIKRLSSWLGLLGCALFFVHLGCGQTTGGETTGNPSNGHSDSSSPLATTVANSVMGDPPSLAVNNAISDGGADGAVSTSDGATQISDGSAAASDGSIGASDGSSNASDGSAGLVDGSMDASADAGSDAGGGSCTTYSQTVAVAADGDDGEMTNTAWNSNGESGVIWLGNEGSTQTPSWGYFRFALSQAIAMSATIQSATLTLHGNNDDGGNGSIKLRVFLEDAANPAQVTSTADRPGPAGFPAGGGSARPLASTYVDWTSNGSILNWTTHNTTPSLAAILQPLVSSHAYAIGDHIQAWVTMPPRGNYENWRMGPNDYPSTPAELFIQWQVCP